MNPSMKQFVIILAFLSIIIFSCKKEKKTELEFDTQTSQDNALAEGTFNDVNNIMNEAMENGSGGLTTYRTSENHNLLLSACATVTVTPNSSGGGGSVAVSFGTSNCQCLDGHYRRGTINIYYTGAYRDSATVITTTFSDYFVGKDTLNMFQVTGTKTVTNKGHNTNGNLSYDINVDGHLINNANVTMNWTSTRHREWIAGESTTGISGWGDDEYLITGSASGTNFEGNSFTVNITTPIHIEFDCWWITAGVFELTPSGKPVRTLNFGNGTCDNDAVVSVNGQDFPIKLR